MTSKSPHPIPPLRELIDTELPASELERLERVDGLLREAGPYLRLVPPRKEQMHELRLTFRELTLIHRSLQAARTLGGLPEHELLDDTMQLVEQALKGAA